MDQLSRTPKTRVLKQICEYRPAGRRNLESTRMQLLLLLLLMMMIMMVLMRKTKTEDKKEGR
jgi:hypothetical protein